jgi:hypothetical protein
MLQPVISCCLVVLQPKKASLKRLQDSIYPKALIESVNAFSELASEGEGIFSGLA